ncbi:Outer membrane protein assembly factor BamE [Vibrio stylophorae]|uniref:Outer membrane protein assembly factor BamE n=1 Tax=Vibrio stylophorae TaxID=659351 RepID=A0ABM8ZVG7_9VIBR|nr:outer membrane protein assembly factor BamE [Vibrio stylophorae]CAH0534329.1 Outer membrane protein assembly factor BamE [Vibrio stylophorae]
MRLKTTVALIFALLLSGCGTIAEKLVYRIDIDQGNYIEQSAVDLLRFGMTKEQVAYVMGSPMIVEPSTPDTWYFVQHIEKGTGEVTQKTLIIDFDKNQRLVGFKGDFTPGPNFFTPLQ